MVLDMAVILLKEQREDSKRLVYLKVLINNIFTKINCDKRSE